MKGTHNLSGLIYTELFILNTTIPNSPNYAFLHDEKFEQPNILNVTDKRNVVFYSMGA